MRSSLSFLGTVMILVVDSADEGLVELAEPLPEVNSLSSLVSGNSFWLTSTAPPPLSPRIGRFSSFLRLLRLLRHRSQQITNKTILPTPPITLRTTLTTRLSWPAHVHRKYISSHFPINPASILRCHLLKKNLYTSYVLYVKELPLSFLTFWDSLATDHCYRCELIYLLQICLSPCFFYWKFSKLILCSECF